MPHTTFDLRTDDGSCPTHCFYPDGDGPWPGVLVYMDGIGMRPALLPIAERIAAAGYYVLLPDLFYRVGRYTAPDPQKLFGDPATRAEWHKRFFSTVTTDNVMRDTRACLAHFAAEPRVRQPTIGTTGYCMGGRFSLLAAGHFPDRIAAAASYHGGNVANDAPDSPHLLAPQMKARIFVAAAENDPADQTKRLDEALAAAGVDHRVETWPAKHGFVPADTPVHDAAAAERHFATLLELLGRTFGA